jgi:hypothetical protein
MRALWLAAALALGLIGCGDSEEPAKVIDWDLTKQPHLEDVDWPKPSETVVSVEPVDSVDLRLPEGERFQAKGELKRVFMERDGKLVTLVAVHTQPKTTADAYKTAADWAAHFDLPREPLRKWERARESGEADKTATAVTAAPDRPIGRDGPYPSVEIKHSFDEKRPSFVILELFWKQRD